MLNITKRPDGKWELKGPKGVIDVYDTHREAWRQRDIMTNDDISRSEQTADWSSRNP